MSVETYKNDSGSFAYENWKAHLSGELLSKTFEHPFYTDSHIIGVFPNFESPYEIFLTFSQDFNNALLPALILRRKDYSKYDPSIQLKTNTQRFHGGLDSDEIAALISLCLGIRMKSGSFNRVFETEGDPKGQPMFFYNEKPVLLKSSVGTLLPRITGTHNLKDCLMIGNFPELSPDASIALIRAARFYQDALWLADSETSLSWVMLVSAIETAANHWRKQKDTPVDKLKLFKNGELYNLVHEKGGDEFAEQIANLTSDFIGSTKKFVDFVLQYLPEPICQREGFYWQHPQE